MQNLKNDPPKSNGTKEKTIQSWTKNADNLLDKLRFLLTTFPSLPIYFPLRILHIPFFF